MPLKDILKKKDKIKDEGSTSQATLSLSPTVPEFTFMRTTTTTQEHISPPQFPGDAAPAESLSPSSQRDHSNRFSSRFRRHSNAAQTQSPGEGVNGKRDRRLSERLHLSRDKDASSSSVNVPAIGSTVAKTDEEEAEWEKRATLLARGNGVSRSNSGVSLAEMVSGEGAVGGGVVEGGRKRGVSVSDSKGDVSLLQRVFVVVVEGRVLMRLDRSIFRRLYGCMRLEVRGSKCTLANGGELTLLV
jgi:hypothetical protein